MLVAKESSSARDVDRQKLRHEQVKSDNNFHYFPKVDYRRIRWLRGMVDGEELGLKHWLQLNLSCHKVMFWASILISMFGGMFERWASAESQIIHETWLQLDDDS